MLLRLGQWVNLFLLAAAVLLVYQGIERAARGAAALARAAAKGSLACFMRGVPAEIAVAAVGRRDGQE